MESKYNYFKRDISWLSFNYRVLLEALDERLPLYERINFISIYSSNLEEFYKIRVADHKAVASGATESDEETVQSARELVEEINREVNRQLDDRVRIYEQKILPALRKSHISFGLPLAPTLVGLYALVFGLSIFVPNEFLAVAFDAGGVTTGPITVPFLMALGSGMAGVQGKDGDNFGMVALCSVGPILMVMLLGVCYQSTEIAYTPFAIPFVRDSQEVGQQFLQGLPAYMKEVALGLLPILVFFAVFQLASIRLKRRSVIKILVGAGYTYIGLVLFLTGANVGFMPAGSFLGRTLAGLPEYWLLVPIGMVVGWFIVAAEPAVHVLNRQVEDVTSGAIPQRAIGLAMSVGVSVSIGLAMLRVCLGIPIYFLVVPGYGLALLLTRFVPNMFTAIAFDSGGVASGPMTATFLLPLTMGACEALGRDILTDAFGVVAMVAMTPLITIQLLGLLYQHKLRRTAAGEVQIQTLELVSDIIDYDEEVER